MNLLKTLLLTLAITASVQAETIYIDVVSFGPCWSRTEWKEHFKEVKRRQKEELGINLKVRTWRHFDELTICTKKFYYTKLYLKFGNCIYRKKLRKIRARKGSAAGLILTPGVPANQDCYGLDCSYFAGIASQVCNPLHGVAMVNCKRESTTLWKDGTNPGAEMCRSGINHECGHLWGACHDEEYIMKLFGGVMDSQVLYFILDEWPESLPYPIFSWNARKSINECLAREL